MKIKEFSPEEFWPIVNMFIEACHGFYVYNFEKKVGFTKQTVEKHLDKYLKIVKSKDKVIISDETEIEVILNVSKLVFKEIDEWEFETLIDITIPEAKELIAKIASE